MDAYRTANITNATQITSRLGDVTSDFAAGFAAATALKDSHIREEVNKALADHAQMAVNWQQIGTYRDTSGSIRLGIDMNDGGRGGVQHRHDSSDTGDQRFVYPHENFY